MKESDLELVRQIIREEIENYWQQHNGRSKAPGCNFCGSTVTNFMGETPSGKRRVRCRTCKKTWSVIAK